MPARQPQSGNTLRRSARLAGNPLRRSERLRLQHATSTPIRALNAANERTPTNSSTIATHSRFINAPRRRSRGSRRWSGVEAARIRQAAAEALSGTPSPNNIIGDTGTPQPRGPGRPRRHPTPYPRRTGIRRTAAAALGGTPSPVEPVTVNQNSFFGMLAGGGWSSLVSFNLNANLPLLRPLPAPPTDSECRLVLGRLRRELQDFYQEPPEGCSIEIVNDNMFHWRASISGPPETPYAGGQFHLELHFGQNYPFVAPRVYFLTKIYHCNVAANGHICLDILSREWSPALTTSKVLLSITCLMADPNPDDPLEPSIASLYKRNRSQHDQTARSWTSLYAKPGQDPQSPAFD